MSAGKVLRNDLADVIGVLMAARRGDADMVAQAICGMTVPEIVRSLSAALVLCAKLADALDDSAIASGLEPQADDLLRHFAANVQASQDRDKLDRATAWPSSSED